MTTNAICWPRMVISRKYGVGSIHKCWMKLTEISTTVRATTEGEVSPISVEEIRKQLAIRWSWIKHVTRPDSYWSATKYERTRDCMSREEIGCSDLTSAIPYSWRLSEFTPLFKGRGIILEWSNYWKIKLMSHTVKLFERIVNHMLRTIYCRVG